MGYARSLLLYFMFWLFRKTNNGLKAQKNLKINVIIIIKNII